MAVLLGGWLAFDGARAFISGDYVTPASGEYAGQLGPWSRLVKAVGLEPRSPVVKGTHIVLGLMWLAAAACFAARFPWARWVLTGCAVASLWYLPFGALIAIIELALLFLLPPR